MNLFVILFMIFHPGIVTNTTNNCPSPGVVLDYKDGYKIGHDFENYIVTLFELSTGKYRLKEWTSDKKATNGVTPESNKYPDLLFEFIIPNGQNHLFAVECKWRKRMYYNMGCKGISLGQSWNLSNYLHYEHSFKIPVWIAIGLGGEAEKPNDLYLIRLSEINSNFIPEKILNQNKSKRLCHSMEYDPKQKMIII